MGFHWWWSTTSGTTVGRGQYGQESCGFMIQDEPDGTELSWILTVGSYRNGSRHFGRSCHRCWNFCWWPEYLSQVIKAGSIHSHMITDKSLALLTKKIWNWNVEKEDEMVASPFRGHKHPVSFFVVMADVSDSEDRTIHVWVLWDVESTETVVDPLKGTGSAVCSVAISNDGDRVVSWSFDSTIQVWDLTQPHRLLTWVKRHKRFLQNST